MPSKLTINLVVGILGIIAILVVIGGIVLTLDDKTIPDALIAIGSGAATGVAALLARTSSEPSPPTTANTVNVTNPQVDQLKVAGDA